MKHAWKSLRLKPGDEVRINDLSGTDYIGTITDIGKAQVVVQLLKKTAASSESPLQIIVYQGLPKGQKMDLVCQKLCELGAAELVPIITRRVVPEVKNEYKKLDRLRRISLEAAKQAGRSQILKVREPEELTRLKPELQELDLLVVPYEEKTGRGLASLAAKIRPGCRIGVVVGPEGGFEAEEISWLEETGAQVVTLGPRILRTETCALSVVSILQYIGGDMGGERNESGI